MSRVKSSVNIFMRLYYTDVHKCASDWPRTIGTCHLIRNLIANCTGQKKNLYSIDVRLFCKRFRHTPKQQPSRKCLFMLPRPRPPVLGCHMIVTRENLNSAIFQYAAMLLDEDECHQTLSRVGGVWGRD